MSRALNFLVQSSCGKAISQSTLNIILVMVFKRENDSRNNIKLVSKAFTHCRIKHMLKALLIYVCVSIYSSQRMVQYNQ